MGTHLVGMGMIFNTVSLFTSDVLDGAELRLSTSAITSSGIGQRRWISACAVDDQNLLHFHHG